MFSVVEVEMPVALGATFQVCSSGRNPDRNVQDVDANGFPARSRIAVKPPVTFTVNQVSSGICAAG
jgi:hypothetical protein